MKKKYRTRFDYFLLIILITLMLLIGHIIYLSVFDVMVPIEFYNLPFPTDKTEYTAGDDVYLTADYCRFTDVPFHLHLRFVDSLVFIVPETNRPGASRGCDTVEFRIATIPESLPPGEYFLHGKNEYKVNWIATRVVEWESRSFTVVR